MQLYTVVYTSILAQDRNVYMTEKMYGGELKRELGCGMMREKNPKTIATTL